MTNQIKSILLSIFLAILLFVLFKFLNAYSVSKAVRENDAIWERKIAVERIEAEMRIEEIRIENKELLQKVINEHRAELGEYKKKYEEIAKKVETFEEHEIESTVLKETISNLKNIEKEEPLNAGE